MSTEAALVRKSLFNSRAGVLTSARDIDRLALLTAQRPEPLVGALTHEGLETQADGLRVTPATARRPRR